jgi:metallo-beta-lactamase family protein
VKFTFYDAGHILGSAYVVVEFSDELVNQTSAPRRLLFTADVGRYNSPIIRDPVAPPGAMDFIITESTYGDRSHGPIDRVGPELLDCVQTCIRNHGRLLIPAFAVGRTQIMLWYIQRFIQDKKMPAIPIFVDSPMGVEASRVHQEFRENYDQETLDAIGKEDLFASSKVTFASSMQESKAINSQQGPCVIIASSPTCEFGRILHHLKNSLERPNDMVVFCGYVPPGTLGRRLQEGAKRVRVFDRFYDLKCQVRTIHGLSAHADGEELLKFLKPALTERTTAYIVHGEADQAEGFAARLMKAGIARAEVPALESAVMTSATGWTGDRKPDKKDVSSDGD